MRRNTRSPESTYGGGRDHRVEHDPRIERNFTPDNEDYRSNSAQYNDQDEHRFNSSDRLAYEHHDRPERVRRYQDEERYRPSNYSDGGHGRKFSEPSRQSAHDENSDNRDYHMNKDFEHGAKQRYSNSDDRYSHDRQGNHHNSEFSDRPERYRNREQSGYQKNGYQGRSTEYYRDEHPPRDERYRQSDWAPQDRYNEIAPDRHREAAQDRYQPQLNSNPNQDFNYHYHSDNHDSLEQEPRRRGRHYREY